MEAEQLSFYDDTSARVDGAEEPKKLLSFAWYVQAKEQWAQGGRGRKIYEPLTCARQMMIQAQEAQRPETMFDQTEDDMLRPNSKVRLKELRREIDWARRSIDEARACCGRWSPNESILRTFVAVRELYEKLFADDASESAMTAEAEVKDFAKYCSRP